MQPNDSARDDPDPAANQAGALRGEAPAWRWIELALPGQTQPLACDASVRARMDQAVLTLVKTGGVASARTLRDICLGLAADQPVPASRAFWQISAAFFEALALQLCPLDVAVKRATSRVLMQYTAMARGDLDVPDRLAQELLLFCAQARPAAAGLAPLLSALRQAYGLDPTAWLADEQTKVIGTLRLEIPAYNAYLNEADEWSRRLETELNEWALELPRPLPPSAVALAQSLANSSARIGFHALADIAHRLAQALLQEPPPAAGRPEAAGVLVAVAEHLRYLLHQFAAGFLRQPSQPLLAALDDLLAAGRVPAGAEQAAASSVPVRAALLDRLVNQTDEVMMTRARLAATLGPLRDALSDLGANLDRVQQQARGPEASGLMTESLNALAATQRQLQRTIDRAEDELQTQAHQIQALQHDLWRTRLVAFDSLAERLTAVVRQAAAAVGKQVSLQLDGGALEIDPRALAPWVGVVEQVLVHLVAQGSEPLAVREQAGPPAPGTLTLTLRQEDGEVSLLFSDDGAERAPELAGPDSGLEEVRSEVRALGGRLETLAAPGQGARVTLVLPLAPVLMQVLLLRLGALTLGVPAHRVERVEPATAVDSSRPAVIFHHAGQRLAVPVDEILGSQELLVTPPGLQLSHQPGVIGISAQGCGAVTLIYDPVALVPVDAEPVHEPEADSDPDFFTTV